MSWNENILEAMRRFFEAFDGYTFFDIKNFDNTAVHFHIKEIPNWLFGINWYENESNEYDIVGTFFCQFEKTIVKFKPSYSEIKVELFTINVDPFIDQSLEFYYMTKSNEIGYILNFMREEPYLAFCRDYHCWNYNFEYHTREEAEMEYRKWYADYAERKAFKDFWDTKILDCINSTLLSQFQNAKLRNLGEENNLFYSGIRAPYKGNEKWARSGPGTYCLSYFEEENIRHAIKEIDAIINQAKIAAKEANMIYSLDTSISDYIHNYIYFYDEDKAND